MEQRGNLQTSTLPRCKKPIAARLPISWPPCKLNIRWHFPSAATDVVFQARWWTDPLPGRDSRGLSQITEPPKPTLGGTKVP